MRGQVIANVVSNALVHTDGSVHLRGLIDADRAIVEVRDHGAGMPAEVVERVTERFFRADPSRSRQRGGSGLGLAIVDAAVTAHGGTVDIASRPGQGTTVRLTFPSAAPANAALPVLRAEPSITGTSPARSLGPRASPAISQPGQRPL